MTQGQSWNRDASLRPYLPKWLTNSLPPHLVSADYDAAGHISNASHASSTGHSEQQVAGRSASSPGVKRAFAELWRDSSTQEKPSRNPTRSVVLVLLSGGAEAYQQLEDTSMVLTYRAATLRKHTGWMVLPGGRVDPKGVDEIDTALREAEEETSLNRETVTLVRTLDSINISRTGFAVNPMLAYWHIPRPLRVVGPTETEPVFSVPVNHLTNPENRMMLGYHSWIGSAFKVDDFAVQGFTDGVLSCLLGVTS